MEQIEEIVLDPITRIEYYYAALSGQEVTPPFPFTRKEWFLYDILNGNVARLQPRTREEFYLAKISGAEVEIPEPITRIEQYLAQIAGVDIETPDPITREEYLLQAWAEGSGGGTYGPADIVYFETKRAKKLKSLQVSMLPIQDLHGHDSPWPAGGGVNQWNPTIGGSSEGTVNGITYTKNSDGSYSFNGTAESSTWFNFGNITLAAGTWTASCTMTGSYTGGNISFGASAGAFVTYPYLHTYPRTVTSEEETTGNFGINFGTGCAVTNIRLWFQIESGETAHPWTPYENLCPISGRTSASAYLGAEHDPETATLYSVEFPDEAGTVYSGTVDIVTGVLRVDKAKAVLNDASKWAAATGTVDFDYNVDFTDRKKYSDSYTGLSCSYIRINTQGLNTGRWRSAASFIFGIRSDVLTLEQIKSDATAGKIEICYDLAQPITYQLTPQQVMSLVGQNVVWSPDGEVTVKT